MLNVRYWRYRALRAKTAERKLVSASRTLMRLCVGRRFRSFLEQLWCPSRLIRSSLSKTGPKMAVKASFCRPRRVRIALADVWCAGRENPNREGAARNARNGAYSRQKLALTAIQSGVLAKEELPLFREALRAGEALGRAFAKSFDDGASRASLRHPCPMQPLASIPSRRAFDGAQRAGCFEAKRMTRLTITSTKACLRTSGSNKGLPRASGRHRNLHGHIETKSLPSGGAVVHRARSFAENRRHRGALLNEALRAYLHGCRSHGGGPDRDEVREEDIDARKRACIGACCGRRAFRQHHRSGYELQRRRCSVAGSR